MWNTIIQVGLFINKFSYEKKGNTNKQKLYNMKNKRVL